MYTSILIPVFVCLGMSIMNFVPCVGLVQHRYVPGNGTLVHKGLGDSLVSNG